jgi:hypothetical protein
MTVHAHDICCKSTRPTHTHAYTYTHTHTHAYTHTYIHTKKNT